jgi:serine/threonine protein kinase
MGVLYRGKDTVLDREVAIKVMSGDFSGDEAARGRFFREARAAARLQHRNIVTIFEFAEDEHGTPYIAMEFLRGRSLSSRMAQAPPLTLIQKLDILVQLCTGLHYAHEQGIVHRDVKPANIWLMEDGTIKLLDFGIAKIASSAMTSAGSVVGSASYMAPEQVAGKEIDGRADVFSAGVVLYEMLSGRKPFEGDARGRRGPGAAERSREAVPARGRSRRGTALDPAGSGADLRHSQRGCGRRNDVCGAAGGVDCQSGPSGIAAARSRGRCLALPRGAAGSGHHRPRTIRDLDCGRRDRRRRGSWRYRVPAALRVSDGRDDCDAHDSGDID